MNLLSTYLSKQIIELLEHLFINNSEAIQNTILSEMKNFLSEGTIWLENKMKEHSTGEKES